jgi:DNA-binding response OmpR family regulator
MPSAPKLADLSVLIVDGNQHQRAITSEILRAAGFNRIFTAETSTDALAELRMWQPRVLILEWATAPVDGITLTKRIRRGEPGVDRTIPIIMLTSRNTVSDVETARLAGVHEYAIKPVSSTALLTRMEAAALRPRRFVDSPVYVGPCRRRKKNDNHFGPRRRLADPISEETQHAKAAESVTRITALTTNFDPGDRVQVRAVYDGARDAKAIALEIGDHPLDRSADSLVRYIEGMGATDKLDAEVVQTHVDALTQLVALPNGQAAAREEVARGLEAVVQKKMRAANSGEAA